MIKIIVLMSGHEVFERSFEPGEYTLGRAEKSDVLLDDASVQSTHAKLLVGDSSLKVVGQSDQWNMALDGEAVAQAEPGAGQLLNIGPFELHWEASESEPEPEAQEQPQEEPGAEPEPGLGDRTVVYTEPLQDEFHQQATVIAASPSVPKAVFVAAEGDLSMGRYEVLQGKTVAGRGDDCGLTLPDPTISRRHAQIEVSESGVIISDLGSTSGILVNDKKVDQAELKIGDRVRLGGAVLELSEAPGQPAAGAQVKKAKPPKAKKPKKPKKEKPRKVKKSPPAGMKASQKSKRPLLYGVLGAAVLILIIAFAMTGGKKQKASQTPASAPAVSQTQQALEMDQIKRMVVINLTKGKDALADRKYNKAVEFFGYVLAVDPKNKEALEFKAQAEGAIAQARAERLRQEQEEAARVRAAQETLTRTEEAFRDGDYSTTIELGNQVLAVSPNAPLARHLVIKAQAALEAQSRAKQEEEVTQKRRQALAGQYLAQARSQVKKKNLKAARESLNKVLEADPTGKSPQSAAAKKLLARVEPQIRAKADAQYKKGLKYLKRGKLESAVVAFTKALAEDPGHQKAAQALAKARKKSAKLAHKLYQEGKVLFSLGERKKACSKWRRALRLVDEASQTHNKIKEQAASCAE